MINFSDINEGILDRTSSKINTTKTELKEMVKRNKLIKKMIDNRFLLNTMISDTMKLKAGADKTHDFIGNEIRFGDFVLWNTYGQFGWGQPDVGFIVGESNDGKFKVCTSLSFANTDFEDPLMECPIVDVRTDCIIVLSRLDNIKSYDAVGRKLFK